jgi:iron complex outermembrane receptor protein
MKRIILIFILYTHQALADHDINLNNVDVYGTYQPRSLLLDGMTESASFQRQRQLVDDTASMLNFFTGVDTAANGGVSSLPIIRGLSDDRINVKVDGVDLISACGNHMDPPTSYLDASNLESVKIFAGITPVSMGGDSIGGSIILNSSKPKFATGDDIITASKVNGFYRGNNDARGGSFMTQFATGNFFAKYSGSYSEANNYYAGSNFKTSTYGGGNDPINLRNDEVGSSGYRLENHNLNFAYKLDNHILDVKLGYQKIPFQGFPNQRMDMTDNEQTKVNLSYFGDFDWVNLEARFYNHNTRQSMQFGSDKEYWYGTMIDSSLNVTPGMPMETRSETNGLNVKANYILSEKDILKTGLEYQRYRLEDSWPPSGTGMMSPRYMKNINDGERDRMDIFAEWERKWNPDWFTQTGLRYTHIETDAGNVQTYKTNGGLGSEGFNVANKEKTFNNLDFTSVAVYTIDDTKTIEGGYAIKNRAPNLYELYAWNTGAWSQL